MTSILITYPDGVPAQLGDQVSIDHGTFTGKVEAVIDSSEKQKDWGIEEFGLMIDASNSGLTFWSLDSIVRDEIQLTARLAK